MRAAVALLVAAAIAAIVGTFLELYTLTFRIPGASQAHSVSAWETVRSEGFGSLSAPPRFGIPVSVAALVLVAGAVLLLRGRAGGRLVVVGGVAGLAGAVWSAGEMYLSVAGSVGDVLHGPDFQSSIEVGDGLLVLLAAVVVAAAGLVLALRQRQPEVVEDDTDEALIHQLETPPFGIPVQEAP